MQQFSHSVALAYCADNAELANRMSKELTSAIPFEHFTHDTDQNGPSNLSARLAGFNGPIILLVSDNFLRSVACMEGGLTFLNAHQNDILPVIIPGSKQTADGQTEEVPTNLGRVSDIIQYINYWQDRYLDLRKQKNEDEELASDEGFADYVKRVREISGQAGEYIRLLRGVWHLSWREFSYNGYEQLFIFLDEPELGDTFRAQFATVEDAPIPPEAEAEAPPAVEETSEPEALPEEAPVLEMEPDFNVSDIPGLSLLDDDPLPSMTESTEEEINAAERELPAEGTNPTIDSPNAEELAQLIEKAWRMTDQEEFDDALTLLSAAKDSYPDQLELRYNLSLMLAQAGRTEEATQEVEALIAQSPEHADALFLAGELADVREDGNAAREYYQQILSLNDELPEVWYQLGLVHLAYFPQAFEATEKALKKAYKFDKRNTDALYQLAQLYLRNEQEDKAIKSLEQLLQASPGHAFARYDLALLYHRQGNLAAAQGAYLQAAALRPEFRTDTNDQAFQVGTDLVSVQAETEEVAELRARIAELEATLASKEEALAELEVALSVEDKDDDSSEAEVVEQEEDKPLPGKGKLVMITGVTSGIGKATAEKFAELGFDLIITGRRAERLQALADEWISTYGIEIKTLVFDVRNAEAVATAVDTLKGSDWQAIDVLVNNAGKAKGLDFIQEGDLAHWDEMVDTNIKGLLYVSRAVLPLMVKQGSGHVINLCSTAGKEVYPKGAVYCATKHAVDALTQGMRLDLHTHGIRVSQVCPAHVEETEFALVRFDGNEDKAKIYEDFQPLRSPDVAEVITFMATQAPHVNVLDVVMQGTQQASSTMIDRSGRDKYQSS